MGVVKTATVQPLDVGQRTRRRGMGLIAVVPVAVLALVGVVTCIAPASGHADEEGAPIFLDKIPAGYRDWPLISVSHEAGNLHSIGAVLGNDVAIKAYREGTLPFPDGAIIAALHWRHEPSEENNKIFGRAQSFVAGAPSNVQFMVKDSKKYAATGGWGFGHFNGRDEKKPGAKALLRTCFPCHNAIKARDLVFTRYAP
jgi:Cytochrome P460